MGPACSSTTDPVPVQLRFDTWPTGENYVTEKGWLQAKLDRCPKHPHGGCSFRRHTPYARKWPEGAKIARWYCPEAGMTFSLLPDFLAAGISGPLSAIEEVVAAVEAGPSIEAVASRLRPDIQLPGAVRWVRRRRRWFREAVTVARGALPVLAGCALRLSAVAVALGVSTGDVLVHLRRHLVAQLHRLARPTGLRPRWQIRDLVQGGFNTRGGPRPRAGPT